MYPLDQAPTQTLLREIQFRIDAMRGCVMPAYEVDELIEELAARSGRGPGESIAPERVARIYARVLTARKGIRGLGDENRVPGTVSASEVERCRHAPDFRTLEPGPDEEPAPSERLDDPTAKAEAQAELRDAIQGIGSTHGVCGARGFIEWFERATCQNPRSETSDPDGLAITPRVSLVEVEHDPDNPAPEKAHLWYRALDGRERPIRLGTVRRWLTAAENASDGKRPSEAVLR